jgi:hypothetical protein
VELSEPPYVRVIDNTRWLPVDVSLDFEEGDTVIVRAPVFARYFDKVRRWSYTLATSDRASDEGFYDRPIATNRAGEAIALSIVYMGDRGREGFLCLLPPPTEVTVDEGICLILEDLCGMQARTPPPAFAQEIRLPGEDIVDAEIAEQRRKVEEAQAGLDSLLASKEHRRGYIALVYEKGVEGLQEVARKAFEEIGLNTRPADPDVSDEFYIGDGREEALVEVRGHRKSAQIDDIRQLIDNQLKYEQKHGKPIKGILLVNAWNELPPHER